MKGGRDWGVRNRERAYVRPHCTCRQLQGVSYMHRSALSNPGCHGKSDVCKHSVHFPCLSAYWQIVFKIYPF